MDDSKFEKSVLRLVSVAGVFGWIKRGCGVDHVNF